MRSLSSYAKACRRRLAPILVSVFVALPFVAIVLRLIELETACWSPEFTDISYAEFRELGGSQLLVDPVGAESIRWTNSGGRHNFLRVKISDEGCVSIIKGIHQKAAVFAEANAKHALGTPWPEPPDGATKYLSSPWRDITYPSWWPRGGYLSRKYEGRLLFEFETSARGWEWEYNARDGDLFVLDWSAQYRQPLTTNQSTVTNPRFSE